MSNTRKCRRCTNDIEPHVPRAESAVEKLVVEAFEVAWLAGYCSPLCMKEDAVAVVKAGKAWWQRATILPSPERIRELVKANDEVDCPACSGVGGFEEDTVDSRNEHTTVPGEICAECGGTGGVTRAARDILLAMKPHIKENP